MGVGDDAQRPTPALSSSVRVASALPSASQGRKLRKDDPGEALCARSRNGPSSTPLSDHAHATAHSRTCDGTLFYSDSRNATVDAA